MVLSSGNSLFVAAQLVSDPSDEVPDRVIKRIVGNIGSPGISLLVPPGSVRMKSASDKYDYLQIRGVFYRNVTQRMWTWRGPVLNFADMLIQMYPQLVISSL